MNAMSVEILFPAVSIFVSIDVSLKWGSKVTKLEIQSNPLLVEYLSGGF